MKIRLLYLDSNHYRLSDKSVTALLKLCDVKRPRPGYETCLVLGAFKVWLSRTPLAYKGPKRRWVWCLYPRGDGPFGLKQKDGSYLLELPE